MNTYITEIRKRIVNMLEGFIFEECGQAVEQVENRLVEILDQYLYVTELMDYWVIVKLSGEEKFEVHIGLQEGEHDNTKIYNIDSIVCG